MARLAILLCLLAGMAQAQNRQPISISLLECHVIYEEIGNLSAARNRGTDRDLVQGAARAFLEAAHVQASDEGHTDTRAWAGEHYPGLHEKWDGRFSELLTFAENKDWIDYCKALGRSRGVIE